MLVLSFEPDTYDVRESPAFPLIRRLKARGAKVAAYDPVARPYEDPDLAGVQLAGSMREAVEGARVVLVVTRWKEFLGLSGLLPMTDNAPLVVDGRRMLEPADFRHYEGIGRS